MGFIWSVLQTTGPSLQARRLGRNDDGQRQAVDGACEETEGALGYYLSMSPPSNMTVCQ